MNETAITITAKKPPADNWFLDLHVTKGAETAFRSVTGNSALYEFDGHAYRLTTAQGTIEKTTNGSLYHIRPKAQRIVLTLTDQQ